jgi:hypothetical protein
MKCRRLRERHCVQRLVGAIGGQVQIGGPSWAGINFPLASQWGRLGKRPDIRCSDVEFEKLC